MKRLYSTLLLLLLAIGSSDIVFSAEYGSGIDPNNPDFIKYLTNEHLAIVFNLTSGSYDFYLMIGAYTDNPDASASTLYIELREGGLDGFVVEQISVNLSSFTVVKIFSNITLSSNTYALVITPQGFNSDLFYYIGAYRSNTYPGDSYVYYDNWYLLDKDIAYSIQPSGGYEYPSVSILSVSVLSDHVEIKVELNNWKPYSNVTLYPVLIYSTIDKALDDPTIVQVDDNGYAIAVVKTTLSYSDAVIKAIGYDADGNSIVVYSSQQIGVDFKPGSPLDQIFAWFNALYVYAGLIFATVQAVIPYAGVFYMLALVGSIFTCIKEMSITPLFDFFYKQYTALMSLASLSLKIAEKIYEGSKTIIDWLIRIIDVIF